MAAQRTVAPQVQPTRRPAGALPRLALLLLVAATPLAAAAAAGTGGAAVQPAPRTGRSMAAGAKPAAAVAGAGTGAKPAAAAAANPVVAATATSAAAAIAKAAAAAVKPAAAAAATAAKPAAAATPAAAAGAPHAAAAAAAGGSSHAASQGQASALLRAARAKWPEGYVAFCVVAKEQHRDMRYWIEYHRWLGVDKFYIIDHNSTRPMLPVLMDYARAGVVEYQYFAGRPRRLPSFTDSNQWRGYHACIQQHARRHAWLGLLDADEFVVFQPPALAAGAGHNLPALLARLEAAGAGGLALNWVLFGSSGHKMRPPAGPLASYTACVPTSHPESTHTKVIAHTDHLVDMGGTPHEVVLKPGARLMDADGAPTVAPKSDTSRVGTLALYHYVLKSRAEFAAKMARGSGAGNIKTWEYWDYLEPLATATCTHGLNVSAAFLASRPKLQPPRLAHRKRRRRQGGSSGGDEPPLPASNARR